MTSARATTAPLVALAVCAREHRRSCVRRARLASFALAGVLAVAVTACKAPVTLEVPADVAWIALVELDASGAPARATPLARWAPGAALPIVDRGARELRVVGWSSAALVAAGVDLDDPALLAVPLQAAAGCDPQLPAPAWAAAWRGDALAAIDVGALPGFTAPWLDGGCPATRADQLALDLRCTSVRCDPHATSTGPCSYQLDLTECGIGPAALRVERSGAVCLDLSPSGWTCAPRPDDATSSGPYACTRPTVCELDAFLELEPRSPPFELRRTALVPGAAYLPKDWERRDPLSPERASAGHLFDVAVMRDRVAVSTSSVAVAECEGRGGERSAVRILDQETMEVVATTPPELCPDLLLATDDGDGFFVTSLDAQTGAWVLSRRDRDGALVRTTTVAPLPGQLAGRGRFALDARARLGGGRIALLFGALTADPPQEVVTVHDAATLAQLDTIALDSLERTWRMASDGADRLLLASSNGRTVSWLDVGTHRLDEVAVLEFDVPQIDSLLDLLRHEPSGQILVAGQGLTTLFAVSEPNFEVTRRAVWADDRALVALATWPLDPHLVLATGSLNQGLGTIAATATFFDAEALRFLPGTYALGYGVASRIERDRAGRLWILLPWAAEVLRLDPRAP